LARYREPIEDRFKRLTEILHQVKAIGNLDGFWGALRGAVGKRASPITCDDFYTRMLLKPGCESGSCILRQQINRTMCIQIDQDGFVVLAFALGPFVHAEGVWRWPFRQSSTPRQAQQRVGTDWHPLALGDPRAEFTADIQPEPALFVRQSPAAAGKWSNHLGQRLGKGDARTDDVAAQEAPHVEAKLHRQTGPRQIGHGALVVAMDVGRFGCAGGTMRRSLGCSQIEDDTLSRGCKRGEPKPRRPR